MVCRPCEARSARARRNETAAGICWFLATRPAATIRSGRDHNFRPAEKECVMSELKIMEKPMEWIRAQEGKAGYIIAWALGVPIPILFLIYLLRGCD
jgi:hypothetical protein